MLSRKRVQRADWSDGWTHRSAVSPHSLNHLRKEPYVSQQWEKSPRVEECLSTHNDIHTTGKICDRGKPFSNVFHLRWQNMTHHREEPCECYLCGAGFLQRSELRNHNPVHTGRKPDECGKAFRHGFSLDSMRTSTQERNHRNVPYVTKISIKDLTLGKQERVHPGKKGSECH